MTLLYTYITNPRKALRFYAQQSVFSTTLLAWALLALFFSGISSGFVVRWGLWFGVLGFFMLFYTFILDIVAQLLGYTPQGLRLFHWSFLSFLPFLLITPFRIVGLVDAWWIIAAGSFLLQVVTVMELYRPQRVHGILILLAPILLSVLGFSWLILVLGVSLIRYSMLLL